MANQQRYFVSGIGTEVGKTVVCAVLVEKLKADYWKPVQAGELDNTDTMKIQSWISNETSQFFAERWSLDHAMSPHAAAALQDVQIKLTDFTLPSSQNSLIVEGAGGLMVPLNSDGDLVIDLIEQLRLPLILVIQNYLGSINHSLLSIEALKSRNIKIAGIIFNGDEVSTSEKIIIDSTGIPVLGRVAKMTSVDKQSVKAAADALTF